MRLVNMHALVFFEGNITMPTRHVQIRLEEEEYASLTRHADSFGKSLQVVTKSLILKAIAEESTDIAAVLTDEERTLIEGVLDMLRRSYPAGRCGWGKGLAIPSTSVRSSALGLAAGSMNVPLKLSKT